MRGVITITAALALGAVTAACTTDLGHPSAAGPAGFAQPPDDTKPAAPTASAAPTTTPVTSTAAPADTKPPAATTTTVDAADAKPEGGPIEATELPIDIPQDLSDNSAFQLIVFQNTRGHLLIGNRRADGGPSVPAVWDSPDGIVWYDAPAPAPPDDQTRLTLTDGVWQGDVLMVAGESRQANGPRAAVWHTVDTRNFAPETEFPVGQRASAVQALAVSERGLLAAGWVAEGDEDAAFVALRATDGSWHEASVPALTDYEIVGMAATGPTVVVTGYDASRTPAVPVALVSSDGGLSFREADASALRGGVSSYLGAAITVPGGFAAPACLPSDRGYVTGIARSVDGTTWTRQDVTITGDEEAVSRLSLDNAGCWRMVADGDTLHFGIWDIDAWVVSVAPDGTATARAMPHEPGVVPNGPPFAIPTPQGIIAVGQSTGGFTAVRLADGAQATGLPRGHPLLDAVDVTASADALLARVQLYPEVIDHPDGSYEWQSVGSWYTTDGVSVAATDAVPGAVHRIQTTAAGDVGLALVTDPADDSTQGANDGTEAFLRPPGGAWESVGLIASGAGGEWLYDVAATATTVVAVGLAETRGADNRSTWAPLVRATLDGRTWSAETLPLPEGAVGGLDAACPLGDAVVAFGWVTAGGTRSDLVAHRAPDGVWSVVQPTGIPEGTTIESCTSDGSRLVTTASGVALLLTSADGVEFSEGDFSTTDASAAAVYDVAGVPGGFVAVGSVVDERSRDTDGAVWSSSDGERWVPVDVGNLDGFGEQNLNAVTVRADGTIVVVGDDDGDPTLWTIPARAASFCRAPVRGGARPGPGPGPAQHAEWDDSRPVGGATAIDRRPPFWAGIVPSSVLGGERPGFGTVPAQIPGVRRASGGCGTWRGRRRRPCSGAWRGAGPPARS